MQNYSSYVAMYFQGSASARRGRKEKDKPIKYGDKKCRAEKATLAGIYIIALPPSKIMILLFRVEDFSHMKQHLVFTFNQDFDTVTKATYRSEVY